MKPKLYTSGTSIKLTQAQHDKVRRIAQRRGVNMATLWRDMVNDLKVGKPKATKKVARKTKK